MSSGHVFDRDQAATRSMHPQSATPRPFLRWAGSKRALLPQVVPHLPHEYGMYFEPFAGSAALFFLLEPRQATIADACSDLMRAYRAVRSDAASVAAHAANLSTDRDTFETVKANRSKQDSRWAAEFIYLNKTCWNGLYRVNSAGEFNVPYGRPKGSNVIDTRNLNACSSALSQPGITLTSGDFADSLEAVGHGDLVFLDPPYVTRHNNNGFIDYNEHLFTWADQRRLAEVARDLRQRGAHVLVTNAFHDDVIDLYPDFRAVPLVRRSNIASNATRRGNVREALLVSL
jgi:DNA adenine methylase